MLLQDSEGHVVDENGRVVDHPPKWISTRDAPHVPTSTTSGSKQHHNQSKEKKKAKETHSTSPRYKKQRSGSRSPGAHKVSVEPSGPLSKSEKRQFELLKTRLEFEEFREV